MRNIEPVITAFPIAGWQRMTIDCTSHKSVYVPCNSPFAITWEQFPAFPTITGFISGTLPAVVWRCTVYRFYKNSNPPRRSERFLMRVQALGRE